MDNINKTFIDGHEYIDLGLPSGVLWATCNIGASKPEEYGNYFAWGETEPKDNYNMDSYKYCKDKMTELTRYCTDPRNGDWGFTDGLIELLPEDDAAATNWGGKWKTPTIWLLRELVDSECTTTEWTTLNDVYGRMITSKNNGRSIFLPAGGYRYGKQLDGTSQHGDYWSCTLRIDSPIPFDYEADKLRISAAPIDYDLDIWKNCDRHYGHNIRPVCFRDEG